jgi:hypothetical protein
MKLTTYLELPDEPYDFNTFRKQLVSWGVQVNYDEGDMVYIVKQKVEDEEFRKRLNFSMKNGISKKLLNLNGVLVNKITNEIVCMGYDTTYEVCSASDLLHTRNSEFSHQLSETDALTKLPAGLGTFPYITPTELAKLTNDDVNEYQRMVDGVAIRVYNDGDSWRMGSGRATNAAKSIWSSGRSFKDLFLETGKWKQIMSSPNLNKNHCYMFIMCHTDNQQVYKHRYNQVYHVLTRDVTTLEEIDVDLGIAGLDEYSPEEPCENPTDAFERMKTCEDTNMGVMIILKNGMRIPIMSNEYHVINKLRGNYANLRCRVIELVHNNNEKMEADFCKSFPTFKSYFNSIKNAYTKMAKELHAKLMYSRIQKRNMPMNLISDEEKHMMNSIWYTYVRARNNHKTKYDEELAKRPKQKKVSNNKASPVQALSPIMLNGVLVTQSGESNQSEEQQPKFEPLKFTENYVLNFISKLPVEKLWSLLTEKPDVSHPSDWRD